MWIGCFGLITLTGIFLHFDCLNPERWDFLSWGFELRASFFLAFFFFISFFFVFSCNLTVQSSPKCYFFLVGCLSVWLWFYSRFWGSSAVFFFLAVSQKCYLVKCVFVLFSFVWFLHAFALFELVNSELGFSVVDFFFFFKVNQQGKCLQFNYLEQKKRKRKKDEKKNIIFGEFSFCVQTWLFWCFCLSFYCSLSFLNLPWCNYVVFF